MRWQRRRSFAVVVLAVTVGVVLGVLLWITKNHQARLHPEVAGPAAASPAAAGPAPSTTGPHAEIGRDYAVRLLTHCGIHVTEFDGRRWKADRPIDTGSRLGPTDSRPAGRDVTTPGVMRLLDPNTLLFTAIDTDLVVVFRPTTEPTVVCK